MATIKDVSQETGLSIGTVSRVLNNRGYISEDARDKVKDAMEKLHYQPNGIARALSTKTFPFVGVIIPTLRNPYFANLVASIERYAMRRGLETLLFQSDGKQEQENQLLQECVKNRVMGIILCSGQYSILNLSSLGIPVVAVERMQEQASALVQCDNYAGGRMAAQLLISKGCRNLLHLSSIQGNMMPADMRCKGFLEACEKAKVSHHEIPFSESVYESMSYLELMEHLLLTYPLSDGIFCSNDLAAAQTLQVCAKRGIKVPQDMKVVGFDDIPLAAMVCPALSTIHQPITEMADMAITVLCDLSEGKVTPSNITMPVCVKEREST